MCLIQSVKNVQDNVEIERRFLVDGRYQRPWVEESFRCFSILQWYLDREKLIASNHDGTIMYDQTMLVSDVPIAVTSQLEENTNWTVRLRKSHSSFILTLKGKRVGSAAAEFEWPISQESAQSILEGTNYPLVEKKRYLWKGIDDHVWEVDEFEGDLAGLIIAEVELETEGEAVIVPPWTGIELTFLRGWSNASLARMLSQQ